LPERDDGVVGAAQAGDRVEQDDDVALVLDQALGLFDHHFGDLHVARGGFVEGRGDNLALHAALHVGDFLGALVDQQHDQEDTSGWLAVIALAMFCSSTVLPVRGGATISARWPLPCGRDDVDDAAGLVLDRRIERIHLQLARSG
jgi:hypothetical protein